MIHMFSNWLYLQLCEILNKQLKFFMNLKPVLPVFFYVSVVFSLSLVIGRSHWLIMKRK